MGFWTRVLEWVAISFSRGSSRPRNWTWVSCTAGRFFTNWAMREAQLLSLPHSCWQPCFWLHGSMHAHSLSCVGLFCDPMGCSPQGSSLHGILQARKLEWVAISFSRGSSWPRDWTRVSCVSRIGRWILYHWATCEASAADFREEMNTIRKEISLTFHFTHIPSSVSKYSTIPPDSEKWKWSHSVVSDSLQPHGLQPPRLLHPWDFPGKSTGVGRHFLSQVLPLTHCHMKVTTSNPLPFLLLSRTFPSRTLSRTFPTPSISSLLDLYFSSAEKSYVIPPCRPLKKKSFGPIFLLRFCSAFIYFHVFFAIIYSKVLPELSLFPVSNSSLPSLSWTCSSEQTFMATTPLTLFLLTSRLLHIAQPSGQFSISILMAGAVTTASMDWGEHVLLDSLPSGTNLPVVFYHSLLLSILCWIRLMFHYLKVGMPWGFILWSPVFPWLIDLKAMAFILFICHWCQHLYP